MTRAVVIIPFRDRGTDPWRGANLNVVMAWWYAHGLEPQIVSDGLEGDAPFNRHRAYNIAVSRNPKAEVFVFTEADMLIHPGQIIEAIGMAMRKHGLVVPFTQYRYLPDWVTEDVRDRYHCETNEQIAEWWSLPPDNLASVFQLPPESTMEGGRSIGAINVVSRATLDITGGFTEMTHGNWYDDNIIEEGFAFLTASPTRFVPGPAVHLYHLPGHEGDHLTDADRAATAHNKNLLINMRADILIGNRKPVVNLMKYRIPGK